MVDVWRLERWFWDSGFVGERWEKGAATFSSSYDNKSKKWITPITHVLITALLIILAVFVLYANKKPETTSATIKCGQTISDLVKNKQLN